MANLSVSGLENQLLDKVFQPAYVPMADGTDLSLAPVSGKDLMVQKELVTYAFRDFVNYFLLLQQQAEAQARQAAEQQGASGPLYASNLHLNIQLESFSEVDPASFNGQGVKVSKMQTDEGVASRIEVLTAARKADGTLSYAVTVLKMAVEFDSVGQQPQLGSGGQTSIPPVAAAGESAGNSLQDFLNRSPYSNTAGVQLWQYENEDALELLEEQERLDAWAADQHMQLLIEAAYQVLRYLQNMEMEAAFGMSKEEKELFEKALEYEPAALVQKALHQFIKKKRLELEMLRKEIKERLALQQQNAKHSEIFAHLDRLINFYKNAEKLLKTQQIDKDKLKQLMAAMDQANMALKSSQFSWENPSEHFSGETLSEGGLLNLSATAPGI